MTPKDKVTHVERLQIRIAIAAYISDRHTVKQAIIKFNTTKSHVYRACREFNIPFGRGEKVNKEIIDMLLKGTPRKIISRELGITQQKIANVAKKYMKCQKCSNDESDMKYIYISCLYDLKELGIPFEQKGKYFKLIICRECRADFMKSIKDWFEAPIRILSQESKGSGINVMINGVMTEVSEKEWDRMYPGSIPPIRINNKGKRI